MTSRRARRPVAPLRFSDRGLTVDRPIAKTGTTTLAFRGPQ